MSWFGDFLSDIPIVGDAYDWITGNGARQENMSWQSNEAAFNREWQEKMTSNNWARQVNENQRNERWQQFMMDKSFQMQNDEYQRRLEDERNYNSPFSQARRLSQVGINPAAMSADQSGGTSFAAPEAPTFSSPPHVGPSVPSAPGYPSPTPPSSTFGSTISSIGSLISSFSQSKLNEAQADRIYKLLEGDVYLQGIEKGMKELEFDIASSTKDSKIMQEFYKWQEKVSRICLNEEMTYSEAKKQLVYDSEQFLNYARGGLSHSEMNYINLKVARFNETVDAQLRLMDAQTTESRAAAGMLSAQGRHYSALAREVNWFNEVRGDTSSDNKVFEAAKNRIIDEARKVCNDANLTEDQRGYVEQKIDLLKKENNIFYAKQISNELKDYLDIGADIYRTSTMQNFFNSESSRKSRRDEFDREHYNDVEETYEETKPIYSGKSKHTVKRRRK